jgi:hypothetical protein
MVRPLHKYPPFRYCYGYGNPISGMSPSPNSLSTDLNNTILFNNGTTASIPRQDMASLIPPPPVGPLLGDSFSSQYSLLSPFLHVNSKITYEHNGQYHKGYLTKRGSTYYSPLSCVSTSAQRTVNLPNLAKRVDLCV